MISCSFACWIASGGNGPLQPALGPDGRPPAPAAPGVPAAPAAAGAPPAPPAGAPPVPAPAAPAAPAVTAPAVPEPLAPALEAGLPDAPAEGDAPPTAGGGEAPAPSEQPAAKAAPRLAATTTKTEPNERTESRIMNTSPRELVSGPRRNGAGSSNSADGAPPAPQNLHPARCFRGARRRRCSSSAPLRRSARGCGVPGSASQSSTPYLAVGRYGFRSRKSRKRSRAASH